MIVNKEISNALHFAIQAHNGQKRSHGGPYVLHVIRVAERVSANLQIDMLNNWHVGNNGWYTDTICAALLHDTLEDTTVTSNDLKSRFGERVATMVKSLTTDGLNNEELYSKAKTWHYYTRIIKLADIYDNVKEGQLSWSSERIKRYAANKADFIRSCFNVADVGYNETLRLCEESQL